MYLWFFDCLIVCAVLVCVSICLRLYWSCVCVHFASVTQDIVKHESAQDIYVARKHRVGGNYKSMVV